MPNKSNSELHRTADVHQHPTADRDMPPRFHLPSDTLAAHDAPGLIWFYALWALVAALSAGTGHSTLSQESAVFLAGGVVCTAFFFVSVSLAERSNTRLLQLLSAYQTGVGIAWTSAYFYFSQGAGDLVLGMYMTVLMYAAFHLPVRAVTLLGAATLFSYLLIIGIKTVTSPALVAPLADGLRFSVLGAIVGGIYLFSRKLRELRLELHYRNEKLQEVVEHITRIAGEDHLTKSANRRQIMEVLSRERARSNRSGSCFSVLLFDLDHFKAINDRHGHLVGDQILSDFASRVTAELRGMDSLRATEPKRAFGRYGGEEFLAVLPETDADGAERVAERIRSIIADQAFRGCYNITVSAGVAEYQHGETIPQLLMRADEALYQAKRDGRNRVRLSEPPQKEDTGTVPNLRILR